MISLGLISAAHVESSRARFGAPTGRRGRVRPTAIASLLITALARFRSNAQLVPFWPDHLPRGSIHRPPGGDWPELLDAVAADPGKPVVEVDGSGRKDWAEVAVHRTCARTPRPGRPGASPRC